jgi:trehalose/maltose hydrolase-like predicted phosphorylase
MRSVRLAPSYVLLELAQPPRLRDLLPTVLGAPKLEHRIRDPMPPRPLHATGLDVQTGLFEQFVGFFNLEEIDLAQYAHRSTPMDVVLGRERTQRSQIIKQPDVVALLALLPSEFEQRSKIANFRYYEPRCDHGSSLSQATHALVAARLGFTELAISYFREAASIDLAETISASAGGVHIATLGGLWQRRCSALQDSRSSTTQ